MFFIESFNDELTLNEYLIIECLKNYLITKFVSTLNCFENKIKVARKYNFLFLNTWIIVFILIIIKKDLKLKIIIILTKTYKVMLT